MNLRSKEELINFEETIAELFNSGNIRHPVHLSYGYEDQLIDIFKKVSEDDWVLCSWRSHYQCLLKGVEPEELKQKILDGHSIALCFPEYRIFSSAIVGGQVPIAVGIAASIKKKLGTNHVWCFMGDMTSETGIAQTSMRYAINNDLPITFIIEDNNKSVMTDTRATWNCKSLRYQEVKSDKITSYLYENKYPHAGAGQRVQF